MISGFFSYDNPVWHFVGKFFDVMILNILWVFCSIPVFTIGASTTAVYYVTLKLVRDEGSGTIRSFFHSFKDNFKQATLLWLIMSAAGLMIGSDIYIFTVVIKSDSLLFSLMTGLFILLGLVWLFILLFVFPLQARFANPIRRTLLNAFLISLRHFPVTLGLYAADLLFVFLALTALPFLQTFLYLLGLPLFCFFHSHLLVGIFDRYLPKEETREEAAG